MSITTENGSLVIRTEVGGGGLKVKPRLEGRDFVICFVCSADNKYTNNRLQLGFQQKRLLLYISIYLHKIDQMVSHTL
ncbi:hypothetical protein CBW58_23340 [Yersinia frederiksenii]|nr:hypothetical protein CBW58_23340 [Yersinia frederiksenii]